MSAVKYSSYSPLRFQVWNLIEPVISPEPGSDSEEPPPIPQEETPRAVTVAAVPVSAVRRVIFWVKVELLVRWWSAVVRRALDAHGQQLEGAQDDSCRLQGTVLLESSRQRLGGPVSPCADRPLQQVGLDDLAASEHGGRAHTSLRPSAGELGDPHDHVTGAVLGELDPINGSGALGEVELQQRLDLRELQDRCVHFVCRVDRGGEVSCHHRVRHPVPAQVAARVGEASPTQQRRAHHGPAGDGPDVETVGGVVVDYPPVPRFLQVHEPVLAELVLCLGSAGVRGGGALDIHTRTARYETQYVHVERGGG